MRGPPTATQSPVSMLQYSMCRGLGQVCYIWSNSPVLYGVLCDLRYTASNYPISLPSRRT